MSKTYLIVIFTIVVAFIRADNVGWKSYFIENPKAFHDIPLIWEKGNQTTVPSWLSGIYVRNGPAQVSSEIMSLSLEMNDPSRGTNYNLILHFSIHLVLPENIWVVGWMDLPNFTVLSLMAQMFIIVEK